MTSQTHTHIANNMFLIVDMNTSLKKKFLIQKYYDYIAVK